MHGYALDKLEPFLQPGMKGKERQAYFYFFAKSLTIKHWTLDLDLDI